jgi:hypothetical protein
LIVAVVATVATSVDTMDRDPDDVSRDMLANCQLVFVTMAALLSIDEEDDDKITAPERRGPTDKLRSRVRRSVESIFLQYRPYYVRRAYRMDEEAFWKLHGFVAPLTVSTHRSPGSKTKTHKNGGNNGLISTSTLLSASIRYFAGGRPDDIAISHGIAVGRMGPGTRNLGPNPSHGMDGMGPKTHC